MSVVFHIFIGLSLGIGTSSVYRQWRNWKGRPGRAYCGFLLVVSVLGMLAFMFKGVMGVRL